MSHKYKLPNSNNLMESGSSWFKGFASSEQRSKRHANPDVVRS
jgi:hypothetical protein